MIIDEILDGENLRWWRESAAEAGDGRREKVTTGDGNDLRDGSDGTQQRSQSAMVATGQIEE